MRRPFCGGLSAAGRWLLPTDAAVQTKDDAGATSRAPHSVGDRVEGRGSLNFQMRNDSVTTHLSTTRYLPIRHDGLGAVVELSDTNRAR